MSVKNRTDTKAGPGRMAFGKTPNPPGTKRIKRFIRDAQGEALAYRKTLLSLAPNDRLCKPEPEASP